MTNRTCKFKCEHIPTIKALKINVYHVKQWRARVIHHGNFKACMECEKIFAGLPVEQQLLCFCCRSRLGTRQRNNQRYRAFRERLENNQLINLDHIHVQPMIEAMV